MDIMDSGIRINSKHVLLLHADHNSDLLAHYLKRQADMPAHICEPVAYVRWKLYIAACSTTRDLEAG